MDRRPLLTLRTCSIHNLHGLEIWPPLRSNVPIFKATCAPVGQAGYFIVRAAMAQEGPPHRGIAVLENDHDLFGVALRFLSARSS